MIIWTQDGNIVAQRHVKAVTKEDMVADGAVVLGNAHLTVSFDGKPGGVILFTGTDAECDVKREEIGRKMAQQAVIDLRD